jgi:hypothetical protein
LVKEHYYNSWFFQLGFIGKKILKSDKGQKDHLVNLDELIWTYPTQLNGFFTKPKVASLIGQHNEKKCCFATGLAIQFLNCIGHLQLTVFICYKCYRTGCKSCNSSYMQLITTQLQLCSSNSFSTTMQLPYDYNHDVMLTSFLSIHRNLTCTMKFFHDFFWNIDIHHPLWLFVLNGFHLWLVAQSKVAMWHINWILEIYIYIYIYIYI